MASEETISVPLDTAAIQDIAGYFLRKNMENPRDNSKIRASGAGHCPRKIGYQLLGVPGQPLDAHSAYTFWLGHALGDHMTFALIELGWVKAEPFINDEGHLDFRGNTEEAIEDQYYKGHYDIFTEPLKRITKTVDGKSYKTYVVTTDDDPEGKRYLLDFKTMSDRVGFFFNKDAEGNDIIEEVVAKKSGRPYIKLGGSCLWPGNFKKLNGIPKDYFMQLHIYARAKKADGLMLVVLAKDAESKLLYKKKDHLLNFPVKVFTTDELDTDTLDELDRKAEYVYSFTEKGDLPPIPDEYLDKGDGFPCKWCSHSHVCRGHDLRLGLDAVRPIALEGMVIKDLN